MSRNLVQDPRKRHVVFFSKIPFQFTVGHDSLASVKELDVKIVLLVPQNDSGGRRAQQVVLTDEKNPSFMYVLLLSEEDFSLLKEKESLLIRYEDFPTKLIELLDQCRSEGQFSVSLKEEHCDPSSSSSSPKSSDNQYHTGSAVLSISESTPFRKLVHLSLNLRAGTGNDIHWMLVDKLRESGDEIGRLGSQNERMSNQLSILREENASVRRTVDELKGMLSRSEQQNENLTSELSSLQSELKSNSSLSNEISQYAKIVKEKDEKIVGLETQIKSLISDLELSSRSNANTPQQQPPTTTTTTTTQPLPPPPSTSTTASSLTNIPSSFPQPASQILRPKHSTVGSHWGGGSNYIDPLLSGGDSQSSFLPSSSHLYHPPPPRSSSSSSSPSVSLSQRDTSGNNNNNLSFRMINFHDHANNTAPQPPPLSSGAGGIESTYLSSSSASNSLGSNPLPREYRIAAHAPGDIASSLYSFTKSAALRGNSGTRSGG